jgi:mannose-6-phosphate isomerase-like protein (cupin superfamily)
MVIVVEFQLQFLYYELNMNKNGFDSSTFSITPFQKRVEKPWGYEIIYTSDDAPANGKILHTFAGKRLSLQYHDEKKETLCLVMGKATLTLTGTDGEEIDIDMEPLKGYYVTPGQVHRFTAITDCLWLESSTPETGNTFRLQDDANRPTETEEMRKQDNRGWTQ